MNRMRNAPVLLRDEAPNTRGIYRPLRRYAAIGLVMLLAGAWAALKRGVPLFVLIPAALAVLVPLWLQYRVPRRVRYRLYEDELELLSAAGTSLRLRLDRVHLFAPVADDAELATLLAEHGVEDQLFLPNVIGTLAAGGWWVLIWAEGAKPLAAVIRPSRRLIGMIRGRLVEAKPHSASAKVRGPS